MEDEDDDDDDDADVDVDGLCNFEGDGRPYVPTYEVMIGCSSGRRCG